MHPLTAITNQALEEQLTGMAVNRNQDRQLANRTPEIDSLAEILLAIHSAESPTVRRQLVVAGLDLIRQIRELNDVEHGCEQRTAGLAQQITPQLAAARRRWTIKRLAAELRPLLADLANHMVHGDTQKDRLARLATIVAEAPQENLRSVALRHELGVRKFTLLQELLDQTAVRL